MKSNLLLVTVAALALAACNKSVDETATTAEEPNAAAATETGTDLGQTAPVNAVQDAAAGVVGQAGAAMANTPEEYVNKAAMGDMYEIQSSRMALEKSNSPQVKQFAQKMIDDHTTTTNNLKSTLQKANLNITPPTQLDARLQGMIDNLQAAAPGDAFDNAYLDQQTAAHEESLTLQRGYADKGDAPALKQLAGQTAPIIQKHLEMVRKIDRSGVAATGGAKQ